VSTLVDFLRALPKVELHVHLVGSASVPTVLGLAARHASRVPTDAHELVEFYTFRDFAHFIDVYHAVNALVTGPLDIIALVDGLAIDLAAGGVRYAEVTVTPVSHLGAGIDPVALAEGRVRARNGHGVELGWVFDVPGEMGLDAAWATLAWVLRHRPDGTVGFGLGAVPSMAEHPLGRLLQWGVPVTLATDDPGMFGCDIVGEYLVAHDAFGLTPAELVDIARTGVDAAYCSGELKLALLAELDGGCWTP
jgi:adenosine deaminase